MINLQQLRQQIQNQLQTNFEDNRFYYQNQNPRVPNGFTPIDQINNFDQEKNRLKTQHTTNQQQGYRTETRRERTGSHQETRYRSAQRPVYSSELDKWCTRGNHELQVVVDSYEDALELSEQIGMGNDVWCNICGCAVRCEYRVSNRREITGHKDYQEPYQEEVPDYGNVSYQVPIYVPVTNWNATKQALEQQFTPPNQNEYSFIYWNTSNPNNEPDLAQIYQSADRRQCKIVLKGTERNRADFNNWIQNVRQRINNRNITVNNTEMENLFTQYAQEAERQINNLAQERNARPTQQDLENERQARNQSRERRQQEFDSRSAAAREVLVDRLGEEEAAHVVENQQRNWENNYRGRGNN